MQTIAKMVILEEKLGLDNIRMYNNMFWKSDSIVFKKHIDPRRDTKTIKDFIDKYMNRGQFRNIYTIAIYIYRF